MKKKIKGILIVAIAMLLASGTTATALLVTNANNITLSSSKTTKTNVGEALDEIYTNISSIKKLIKNEDGNYKSPICIRAKTLNQETCDQRGNDPGSVGGKYCSATGSIGHGNIITYGNTTTIEGVLNTGDAFICDVNDDRIYDEETERFYYVSDYYDTVNSSEGNDIFDEETAVLIFYANTYRSGSAAVQIDNTQAKAYNTSNYNYQGPSGLKTFLPKTTEWKNVSLKVLARQMRSEEGTKTVNNGAKNLSTFNYSGYAARLLTVQEINKGCELTTSTIKTKGSIDTNKCRFLLENTAYANSRNKFGYWLETPSASDNNYVWELNGTSRTVGVADANTSDTRGVRPAIEVAKSDISY